MTDHLLTINRIDQITHDVRLLTCDRPSGYEFTPGQATELSLDQEGWRDEARPFTFTSIPSDDHLEFVIKSYPDHDGVTEQIGMLDVGAQVRIGDAWGAIEDRGPGMIIAGGAGITPFLSILRARLSNGGLDGFHLVFSNKTEADIILRDELEAMPGLLTTFVVTDEPESEFAGDRLDRASLERMIDRTDQAFYVCGPPAMVEDVSAALEDLGADPDGIVFEN